MQVAARELLSIRVPQKPTPSAAPATPAGVELGLPSGWFAVATSEDLAPGRVLRARFMSDDLVLYRTAAGEVRATAPYCPHLGAHLGHCGSVEGETLRCEFHGFRFDAQGACVATAYGKRPPPAARLPVKPVREAHGVVFVHHDPSGKPPSWELPEVDFTGWTKPSFHRLSFRGHPQETTENSVDVGHFAVVHGYSAVETVREAVTDGPHLNACYAMTRGFGALARFGAALRVVLDVHAYGLGFSLVEVEVAGYGLRLRYVVLATPTEPGHVDMRLGVSVKEIAARELGPLAPLLPRHALTEALARLLYVPFESDVRQDVPFWENKRYTARPALAAGDGPIALYRKWAGQFYPEAPGTPGMK